MSRLRNVAIGVLGAVAITGCSAADMPKVESQQSVQSTQPSSTAVPQFGWDLTSENVGLRSKGLTCEELPEYAGPTDVPSGTSIREKRITKPVNVSAGGILIERSCIQPTEVERGMPVVATTNYNNMEPAAGMVIIHDSEFDGSLLSEHDSAMATAFIGVGELTNNFIHHFGSGIALMITGPEHDALVELNYVTELTAWGDSTTDGNHSDAFTVRDFAASSDGSRKATIRNNRFDCDSGNDTGALFVQTYAGPIDNLTIEGNLMEGGGYQLGLNETNHPYSDVRAVNNRFSGTGFGTSYVEGGSGWDVWEENYLFEPDQPNSRGAPVQQP